MKNFLRICIYIGTAASILHSYLEIAEKKKFQIEHQNLLTEHDELLIAYMKLFETPSYDSTHD